MHIANGQIVKLENLGSFQAQLQSHGSSTEDTYSPSLIRKVTLQFRPGIGLKGQLNKENLQFHKVVSLKKLKGAAKEEAEEPVV